MTNKMYDRFFDLDTVEYNFFYKALEFEKTAATRVSRSSANWEQDILKKLEEEKPFVLEGTDYLIKFKEVDGERGYAFGSVIISNVPEQVRIDNNAEHNSSYSEYLNAAPSMQDTAEHIFIPITIKDYKLDDFDIFVTKGQPRSLTEQNFFRHMFNQDVFGNAVRTPGENRFYFDEMADKQSPPYSSDRHQVFRSSGFLAYAAAGMDKQAHGQEGTTAGIVEQVLPTISASDRARMANYVGVEDHVAQFAGTEALHTIDKILKGGPLTSEDKIIAFKDGLPNNVVRIERTGHDKYTLTCTADWIYEPRGKSMSLVEIMDYFREAVPNIGTVLADIGMGQDAVLTIDHKTRDLIILEDYTADPKILHETGYAHAISKGGDILEGHFLREVYEPTGAKSPGDLFFTGEKFAYQNGVVGEYTKGNVDIDEGSLSNGVWGTFMFSHKDKIAALTPFKIIATSIRGGKVVIKTQDIYSNMINYLVTPGVQKIVNLTGNMELEVGMWNNANSFAIPTYYKFIHLGYRMEMEADPESAAYNINRKLIIHDWGSRMHKEQNLGNEQGGSSTIVIKRSDNGFIMGGPAMSPIMKTETESWIRPGRAMYYLILLGADASAAKDILEKAKKRGVITVTNCKNLDIGQTKLSTIVKVDEMIEKAVGYLNRDLIKEAGELASEDSVDSVLSLAFINPENLSVYLQNMERLENAENDLSQLLLLTRLGLDNVNESAVVSALRNLSEVNEDLRFVNFLIENKKLSTD